MNRLKIRKHKSGGIGWPIVATRERERSIAVLFKLARARNCQQLWISGYIQRVFIRTIVVEHSIISRPAL